MATASKAVFLFPSASGHVNPSLPLARALVDRGWIVEYFSIDQFRAAIEDTGAVFLDRNVIFQEHGVSDMTALVMGTLAEYGESAKMWALNFGSISTERLLGPYMSVLAARAPQLLVYCPVLCQVGHFAAMRLGIPDVSLLTANGPGYWDAAFATHGGGPDDIVKVVKGNEPNEKSVKALRAAMGMPELSLNTARPLVFDYYTGSNLVTTTEELADPMNAEDAAIYGASSKSFVFVGPLLDVKGAKRAGGHLLHANVAPEAAVANVLDKAMEAKAAGRNIIYVSMGTVLTGDSAEHGWTGTSGSAITGRELCQAVYHAVFAVLGGTDALVILALGQQPDALEGISVPSNVVHAPVVPQVDLLRQANPALFVTHGGQNSLMESASVGTPVLVCPGFGDQISNAAKAESQGWGRKVNRPKPEKGDAASYQAEVREALQGALAAPGLRERARQVAEGLSKAEGVEGAVRICEGVASRGCGESAS